MNPRTLLVVSCIASACLFIAAPANAQNSKKKPKEIVVVGSKVTEVVREAGAAEETSLTPPALDDRNFKDLDSDEKKNKESGDKGEPDATSARNTTPATIRSSGARKPDPGGRPGQRKRKPRKRKRTDDRRAPTRLCATRSRPSLQDAPRHVARARQDSAQGGPPGLSVYDRACPSAASA